MNGVSFISLHIVKIIMELIGSGSIGIIISWLYHGESTAQTFMPWKGNKVGILELFLILVHHIDKLGVGVSGCVLVLVVVSVCEIASTLLAISGIREPGCTQV